MNEISSIQLERFYVSHLQAEMTIENLHSFKEAAQALCHQPLKFRRGGRSVTA